MKIIEYNTFEKNTIKYSFTDKNTSLLQLYLLGVHITHFIAMNIVLKRNYKLQIVLFSTRL